MSNQLTIFDDTDPFATAYQRATRPGVITDDRGNEFDVRRSRGRLLPDRFWDMLDAHCSEGIGFGEALDAALADVRGGR